jgi:hypothetical protein
MIAISFNSDVGDSWECSDDRRDPEKYSDLGFRIGVNYIVLCDDALRQWPARTSAARARGLRLLAAGEAAQGNALCADFFWGYPAPYGLG